MTKKLENIIKDGYLIFEKYKVSNSLDVCTDCCITPNQESELLSLTVKHIPHKLMYDYNTGAKVSERDINEFKHFLPRIMELTAMKSFTHHSMELIFRDFENFNISQWENSEIENIKSYFEELFKYFLNSYPLPALETIDSMLIMIYKSGFDLNSILYQWSEIITESSLLFLSDLLFSSFEGKNQDKLQNAFADKSVSLIIYNWLNSDTNLIKFKPLIESVIMNEPKEIGEWQMNHINWTYEKLNELEFKTLK